MLFVRDAHIVVSVDGFGQGPRLATQPLVELTLPIDPAARFVGFVLAKVISGVQ